MIDPELSALVALLFAAYDRRPPPETIEIYEQRLAKCDRAALKEAVVWFADNFEKLPAIANIREKVSAIMRARESRSTADALREHELRWAEEQRGDKSN